MDQIPDETQRPRYLILKKGKENFLASFRSRDIFQFIS